MKDKIISTAASQARPKTNAFVLADRTLPKKFKLLIAMALNGSHGAVEGVRSLAGQAIKAGATKEEITETIKVAQYIKGIGCVCTATRTFKDLFVLDNI